MKNRSLRFSLAALIANLLIFVSLAEAQKNVKPVEPTAKEAVRQIMTNGDILLSSIESCKSVGTSKSDKTILDFLSGVLSFQAEPESQNRLEFSFTQEKGARNEIVWVCDLTFRGQSKDEETVWANGFRFKMKNADRRLIRSSLMCTGTG